MLSGFLYILEQFLQFQTEVLFQMQWVIDTEAFHFMTVGVGFPKVE